MRTSAQVVLPCSCEGDSRALRGHDGNRYLAIRPLTFDSLKVTTRRFKKNGVTWRQNHDTNPNFVSLNNPGGSNDEYWYTSNSGLIYSQDKPGVNDGGLGYIDYTWLQWDIRGTGFVRLKNTFPDIGPYEK